MSAGGEVSAWTQRQTGLKTLPFRKLLLRTVIIEVNLLFNVATDEISLQRNVKFVVRLNLMLLVILQCLSVCKKILNHTSTSLVIVLL